MLAIIEVDNIIINMKKLICTFSHCSIHCQHIF